MLMYNMIQMILYNDPSYYHPKRGKNKTKSKGFLHRY